jgi:hypothetical protein
MQLLRSETKRLAMRLGVLFALGVALSIGAWHAGRALADVDLTGNWNIVLQTDNGTTTLPAILTQSGTSLTVDTGGFPLTGTINPSTGAFHVTGIFTEDLLGSAAPDGNSMSGTWSISMPSFASGPFTGQRKPPPSLGGVAEYPAAGHPARGAGVLVGLAAGAFALLGAATFALRRSVR